MLDVLIKGGLVVDGTGAAPRTADIGIADGRITELGRISSAARRVIDADGATVTPGWVDAHTHYDGQVTWDDQLEGSSANGVTTVVMGNCGVGFAPVRPDGVDALINLMEGVEDIPGTALHEGMPWGQWESFPEYLQHLAGRRWSVDVGAQVAHGALRFYVMGERAVTDAHASAAEVAEMARLLEDASRAGALGFSTSRVRGHMDIAGRPVPGTFAPMDELMALARAMQAAGGRVFQAIAAGTAGDSVRRPEQAALLDEVAMLGHISRETRQPVVFSTIQLPTKPAQWRDVLAATAALNQQGAQLAPMVAPRAVTWMMSLPTYHPFMRRPTFLRLAAQGHDALVAALHQPAVKAQILAEDNLPDPSVGPMANSLPNFFRATLALSFAIREGFDYEPDPSESIVARADAAGRDPLELLYDVLLEDAGRRVVVMLSSNFADGTLDCCRTMIQDPHTVIGLSDAGAHVRFICDMSSPTYSLTHWVRDRRRGERLPIELVVAKSTSVPARLFGLHDRGRLQVGARADINVIDLPRLREHLPHLRNDLPAGGQRFLQLSTGYLATLVNGVPTREHDADTGARPGRLARPS